MRSSSLSFSGSISLRSGRWGGGEQLVELVPVDRDLLALGSPDDAILAEGLGVPRDYPQHEIEDDVDEHRDENGEDHPPTEVQVSTLKTDLLGMPGCQLYSDAMAGGTGEKDPPLRKG